MAIVLPSTVHHTSAKPAAHFGKAPAANAVTKRWERVTCGTCKRSRGKARA